MGFRVLERDVIKGTQVLEIEDPFNPERRLRKVYRYLEEKLPPPDNINLRIAAKVFWQRLDWHVELARQIELNRAREKAMLRACFLSQLGVTFCGTGV